MLAIIPAKQLFDGDNQVLNSWRQPLVSCIRRVENHFVKVDTRFVAPHNILDSRFLKKKKKKERVYSIPRWKSSALTLEFLKSRENF